MAKKTHMISCKSNLLAALIILNLSLAGCSSPEQKEAEYIKRGNELFDKGQFEKARIEYKNAARIKPADPEIAYRFGLVDEAEGDIRGAFGGFAKAEQQDAHYRPALLKLAEYYMSAELNDEAEKRLNTALADAPDNADVLAMHAAYLIRTKNFDGAEKEARRALSLDPSNVVAYSALTGTYEAKGDTGGALKVVEDGISHNATDLALLLLKATIYQQTQDLPKTTETYQKIFELAPNNPLYRAKLALIDLDAGRIDDAEKVLRQSVAALPANKEMKHQLVLFLADHRGLDEAEKEIRDYMQADAKDAEYSNWLVNLYLTKNEPDKAVAYLKERIEKNQLNKEGVAARATLARINYAKGDKARAETLSEEVLQNDPNNLDARFIKAHIEADKGSYQNAVTDLRSIIRDKPKTKEALFLLSEILVLQNHLDLAIDTMNQFIELDPLNFEARIRLAQLYHKIGDSQHAMSMLFAITKTQPKLAVAWENTARIAIDTKDWQTADTAISTLDKLDGQHPVAVYLRGLLLSNNEKYGDAIEHYKEVISADPSSPIAEYALKALVLSYQKMGQPDEATKYIASLKDQNPTILTILGESSLMANKQEQAAADFDAAIASHSPHQDPYLDRARMYVFDHKNEQALEVLQQGTAIAPADIRAPLMEAEVLVKLGRYKEAVDLYDELLARNPELDGVANNLAETIADYQFADPAALAKAQRVAERFSATSNPILLDTLAWVYYRQGNIDQAQTIMQRIVAQGKELPPQIHYHIGAILVKAGRTEQAKIELQKAVTNDTSYPGLDDAKKLLTAL